MQNACCWALLILSFGNSLLPKSHACPTWDFALVLAVRRRCCSMLFLCGRSAGNLNFVQDNGDDKDGAKSKDSSSKTGTRIHRFVVNHALVPGAYRTTPKRKTVPLADGLLAWQVTAAHSCSPWANMANCFWLIVIEVGLWLQGKTFPPDSLCKICARSPSN